MVLGLKSKSRKVTSVQVDYLVHIQEIKPWPTSEPKSVKSAQSVVLQWQNGDQVSGSFVSAVGDGKVEFDQPFKLSVTLYREEKSKSRESFQKNLLEIYLYEPPNDKEKKGQIVGTSMINLAEYGIIEEAISISSPVSCKKSFRNATQPVIFVKIQPLDRESSSSSPLASSSKAASFDMEGSKSLSEIMSNEGEVEIESFTDDDDCLSSTRSIPPAFEGSGGSPQKGEFSKETNHGESTRHSRDGSGKANEVCEPEHQNGSYSAADSSSQPVDYAENRKATRTFTTRFEQESTFDEKEYEDEQQNLEEMKLAVQNLLKNIPPGAKEKKTTRRTNTLTISNRASRLQGSTVQSHKLKHLKSVQIPLNSVKRNDAMGNRQNNEEAGTSSVQENSPGNKKGTAKSEGDVTLNGSSDNKNELKSRIDMLEEELREAAAVEVGLYSIIAEHGSSINKVHAPARRLSRFYLHAYKSGSASRRASAARAIISGLILVSKACGNDVPRLTFWFSNSIALRAILVADGMPLFAEPGIKSNGSGKNSSKKLPRGWTKSYPAKKTKNDSQESSDNWEDPKTFAFALENFESWVFSRTVESVWWQTLTPHMQSAAAKGSSSRKPNGKKLGLRDQQQGNFSIDLWKKAFKDACERLCPLRAGGHECGCLPLLAKLVMEQLVVRLDVAMFNAILRESADDMPTDPVSDPISDPKVLPIPAGKSSFGAGVQLKNAIGNWSRWLTDLFGIDDTDQPEDAQELYDQGKPENETSFKAFHLLNSLSDLMMLPLEMLSDISTRKEVCPTFSVPLIKRILSNFVPDEFSPDPVPASVFKALEAEESDDVAEEFMTSFPISATSILYLPPSAASLAEIMGEPGTQTGNRSSVLKKSYTSDDELDELDSPMTLINMRNLRDPASSKKTSLTLNASGGRNVVRYKLLREVWRDNE